ncbi:MAG: F0F1 ATP synthase subunit A [Alphaproteobacteria bacterium]|nr:F0F1 ATP synthase subunit A [Alphaproteobacteria bacterium]MBF0129929.1 F0F1 ATP synthase subunit A [Alphaproteobacteria bacterium]
MASPVHQFEIHPLIPIQMGGVDVSFTNSALFMVLAVVASYVFLVLGMGGRSLVPGRWQSLAEVTYEFVANMVRDNVGKEGARYFPFIFTLFMFVTLGNILGMMPYGFTYTSHIAVTGALALTVFIGVTIIGFARHGLHFLRMFFPHGAPILTAPILIPIELISYLSRPFSLSVRLFANMTVGHIMLKVLAGFIVTVPLLLGIVPLAATIGITILEFGIAFLQAYVFTILSCIYLNDAINMH